MLREIAAKLDAQAEPDEKVQQFVDLDVHQLVGELNEAGSPPERSREGADS